MVLQPALAIVVPIADSAHGPSVTGSANEETVKLMGPEIIGFLNMSPKRYYEITGQKMKFRERLALKMAQQQMRKSSRNGRLNAQEAGDLKSGKFDLLWFLIGLITIPIGILLAFLLTKNPNARKSALYGAAIGAVILVFFLLL